MWRQVNWNANGSSAAEPVRSLPEGPNKHQTPGAYFKTPASTANDNTNNDRSSNTNNSMDSQNSIDRVPRVRSTTPTEEEEQEVQPPMKTIKTKNSSVEATGGNRHQQRRSQNKTQQHQLASANPHAFTAATALSSMTSAPPTTTTAAHPPTVGFRSRLSSISGALQHPKLARRLFSHHQQDSMAAAAAANADHHPTTVGVAGAAPIQITTTSIDSPQHNQNQNHHNQQQQNKTTHPHSDLQGGAGTETASGGSQSYFNEHEARLMSTQSGRRLSQLFLPQVANNPLLLSQQLEYAANHQETLIPPHLLGLYGQPPLVGGIGSGGGGGMSPGFGTGSGQHRASWADISLFGRLSNMRPSIDSAFHSTGGQFRHSFDARSEQNNCTGEQLELEEGASCVQIMKKLLVSLALCLIIAICWIMIIHTLKWVAIRGNEFELLLLQQQQQQQQAASSATATLLTGAANPRNFEGDGAGGGDESDFQLEGSAPARLSRSQRPLALLAAAAGSTRKLDDHSATTESFHNNNDAGPLKLPNKDADEQQPASTTTTTPTTNDLFLYSELRLSEMPSQSVMMQLSPANSSPSSNNNEQQQQQETRDRPPPVSKRRRQRQRRSSNNLKTMDENDNDNDNDDDEEEDNDDPLSSDGRRHRIPDPAHRDKSPGTAHRQRLAQQRQHAPSSATTQSGSRAKLQRPVKPNTTSTTDKLIVEPPIVAGGGSGLDSGEEPLKSEASMGVASGDGSGGDGMDGTILPLPTLSKAFSPAAATASASIVVPPPRQRQPPPSLPLLDSPPAPSPTLAAPEAILAGGPPATPTQLAERAANWMAPNALMFKAPFFTSWFVSIWNILFMPVFTLISSCCFRHEDQTTKKLLVRESISQFMDNGLTTLQFLTRCAFFSVLWIGTIFGIVYSLSNIDATVVMALFACSAALVYLLSWVLLHQQFVGVRIVAVIICTTGIALLAYMDNSRTLGSVLIVAGSALCAAVYKVIYQRMFGFWSIAQMSLFFTLVGLFNAFLMWPLALLLYFLGVELIVWRYIPWMHLTAAGALHLTANIVAYFGPICSYEVFLTMGLLIAVVLSAVIDVTFYKITFEGMKLAGVLLLMIGFLVCLLPENWNEFLYDLVNERFVRWKKERSLKKSRNKVQDLSTGQTSRLRTPSGRVK